MPFDYDIDPRRERVTVIISGRIAVGALIGRIRDLIDDPAFDPQFDTLADCRGAQIGAASFDLSDAINQITQATHGGRRAIVASDDGVAGLAERYTALRGEPDRVRIFATVADAETWLNEKPT